MKRLAVLSYLCWCVALSQPLNAEPSPSPSPDGNSISPDKQWQFVGGDKSKVLKAATNEVALEFSCSLGERDSSLLLWAPDSTRFAIACADGKGGSTSVYQLRSGKWAAGDALGNGDEIMERAGKNIEAQARKKGMSKKLSLHMIRWTVDPQKWTDASTLVVHAAMEEVAHGEDGRYAGTGYAAHLLLTLKFDDSGAWKIIKTHEMSAKEVKQTQRRAR